MLKNVDVIQSIKREKIIKPTVLGIILIFLFLFPLLFNSPYYLHIMILTLVYIICSSSLRLIYISGQMSLAHGAFMGIGAYTSAVTATSLHWPIWLTIPLGGLVAMVIGIVIAYPFARLRALYYAMVSLFFGVGVLQVIIAFAKWTGGYNGLTGVPPLLGYSKVSNYYFFLGLTIVCLLAMYRFEFSRIGTNLKAIAQSYLVASSVGINEVKYRVIALAVGCFFVGIAGATYAHYNMIVSPDSFNLIATLWIVMYMLVGGADSFYGPIIGTVILILFTDLFSKVQQYTPFISAAILLIVVYILPKGLISIPSVIWAKVTELRKGRRVTRAP